MEGDTKDLSSVYKINKALGDARLNKPKIKNKFVVVVPFTDEEKFKKLPEDLQDYAIKDIYRMIGTTNNKKRMLAIGVIRYTYMKDGKYKTTPNNSIFFAVKVDISDGDNPVIYDPIPIVFGEFPPFASDVKTISIHGEKETLATYFAPKKMEELDKININNKAEKVSSFLFETENEEQKIILPSYNYLFKVEKKILLKSPTKKMGSKTSSDIKANLSKTNNLFNVVEERKKEEKETFAIDKKNTGEAEEEFKEITKNINKEYDNKIGNVKSKIVEVEPTKEEPDPIFEFGDIDDEEYKNQKKMYGKPTINDIIKVDESDPNTKYIIGGLSILLVVIVAVQAYIGEK